MRYCGPWCQWCGGPRKTLPRRPRVNCTFLRIGTGFHFCSFFGWALLICSGVCCFLCRLNDLIGYLTTAVPDATCLSPKPEPVAPVVSFADLASDLKWSTQDQKLAKLFWVDAAPVSIRSIVFHAALATTLPAPLSFVRSPPDIVAFHTFFLGGWTCVSFAVWKSCCLFV